MASSCATEQELRRPEWVEGVPIRLADGQEWTFPRPRLSFRFYIGPDGALLPPKRYAPDFACDYGDVLDRLKRAEGDGESVLFIAVGLALILLRRNYTIADDLVPELLSFDAEDDGSMKAIAELLDLVRGYSPKPSAVGSASEPVPTASIPT